MEIAITVHEPGITLHEIFKPTNMKPRKTIPLETKNEIIQLSQQGMKAADIARHFGIKDTNVHGIIRKVKPAATVREGYADFDSMMGKCLVTGLRFQN